MQARIVQRLDFSPIPMLSFRTLPSKAISSCHDCHVQQPQTYWVVSVALRRSGTVVVILPRDQD